MYVPEPFALSDRALIAAVMRENAFAVLVTAAGAAAPRATHLPFLYDPDVEPNGQLIAHMARANPHWHDLARLQEEGGEALVLFQGPHSYVSPRWYGPGPAVPTWNYVAVHAYGTPRLLTDPAPVRALLERLTDTYEAGAAAPWRLDSQDDSFVRRNMRAIVAFEIPIARLEAKAKLSQNKPAAVRQAVAAALAADGDSQAQAVADLMGRCGPPAP